MPLKTTALTPHTEHVSTVKFRLHARRRPDSNRDMADLQSAALAIWLRRHKNHKTHNRQIHYKYPILRPSLPRFHNNLPKIPILARLAQKILQILPIFRTEVLRPLKTMILRPLFCTILVLGFAFPCLAQQKSTDTDKHFTANVLKQTLFAKTDDERKFCDCVIQKRDNGTLPVAIIYGVYQKAMTKDQGRRFAYFKAGLELVCQQRGIVLYPTPVKTSSPASTFTSFKNIFSRI